MSTISRLTTSTSGSGNGDSGSNTQATPTNNVGSQNEDSNYQRGRRQNAIQLTNLKSYKGSISDIGAVLALRHEKLDHKKQFQVFMEKVGTYVLSNLEDGGVLSTSALGVRLFVLATTIVGRCGLGVSTAVAVSAAGGGRS